MSKNIIGYTTGVFDLFHIGHLNILTRAKMQCDYLIVGITTDELCEQRKAKKPIIPFVERMEIVKSIRFVDEVVAQVDMEKMLAWRSLKFDKMFVGDDWRGTPEWKIMEEQFNAVGVEVVYFPYTRNTSSTLLRHVLEELHSRI